MDPVIVAVPIVPFERTKVPEPLVRVKPVIVNAVIGPTSTQVCWFGSTTVGKPSPNALSETTAAGR